MKTIVRIALAVIFITSLASCVKTVEVPQSPAANPIAGSWIITDAAEDNGNGWYAFDPGIDGVFTFYLNGAAEYDDGYSFLQGNWDSFTENSGYYDAYGNYYSNTHSTFQVAAGSHAGGSIDLYFDNISFINRNAFTGTYYNGNGIEKYTFSRY